MQRAAIKVGWLHSGSVLPDAPQVYWRYPDPSCPRERRHVIGDKEKSKAGEARATETPFDGWFADHFASKEAFSLEILNLYFFNDAKQSGRFFAVTRCRRPGGRRVHRREALRFSAAAGLAMMRTWPYRIRPYLLMRNRVAMAPMTRETTPDGIPDLATAAYYRRRAEGVRGARC